MMELYVITSTHSNVPLGEIRTDGTNIDWILDNSDGKLSHMAGGDFVRLKSIIDKSSHLEMKTPTEATVGLLRYSLENGDIVEITTDGKTAQLNGKIMPEEEKFGLMSAIASGKIKVKNKADISKPFQLIPRAKPPKREAPAAESDTGMAKVVKKSMNKNERKRSLDNRNQDSKINSVDFSKTECPAFGTQLLYLLKYGEDDA